ncbi:unnamed protein product [Euphydryas editha]|uniref:Major facilitator superfamily (MFS) profile domain-containing protein n=1 Tax=Euphydryas editha TaxID=104508 RepID=A0AAU9TJD6_EUPED|nr:unnamed protein product [Euphydryas editha]
MEINENNVPKKFGFEDALNLTGFGKYNFSLLVVCCLLILAMYIDIFGFSVVLPSVACDMGLSTSQQGFLSAIPLIGVMISSYAWGLCADTLGRRSTLLLAMPIGMVLNLAASIAPTYISLAVLKFFSASFTSSANAAGFVLVGESVPVRFRGKFVSLMASATMYVQFVICVIALPVTRMSFSIDVSWLPMTYRPWRLLLQVISLPGIIGAIGMMFVLESPKFLLSKGREESSIEVLKVISKWNTGLSKKSFPVESIFLEESEIQDSTKKSFLVKIWNQTAPLFKPPLLKNSLILYYILLCAYMTSTGYTMWVPTMTNAFFTGEDSAGKTFCEVASTAAISSKSTTASDCDNIIKPMTLYAVICYSGLSGTLNILLTFVVGPLGKRRTTVLVFSVALISGIALLFIRIPIMSIVLFFLFLYVALILGNVNTYLVELNPTYLRGMATCLSVVVARGFGFLSIQLIASLLANYCTSMISGYIVLIFSGLVVSFFLPLDNPENKDNITNDKL